MEQRTTYIDGELEGLWEFFDEDGNLIRTGTFRNGEEVNPPDISESFWPNGQLRSRGTYIDEKRDGLWEEFFENGQLESRQTFRDGELNGLFEYCNRNGQIESGGNSKDGQLDGVWQ